MKYLIALVLTMAWLLFAQTVASQVPYTANNQVPAYEGSFRYGTNMGYYNTDWPDTELANLAAGNPDQDIPGLGMDALRLSLPNHFLNKWGYDIELPDFAHYHTLGMEEMVVFLQGPAENFRSQEYFCDEPSELFANMYLPIWDDGANGTPVNEDNYFASYVYETIIRYGEKVRYWEIVNEPDFTYSPFGWYPEYLPESWFVEDPQPCDLPNLKAPIYHYIRMLRVAYQVIKSVYPDHYVTPGGLGYASFLDALLRNTDNPVDGSVTEEYPLQGGAYFDAVSFHSYPHVDGSCRHWDSDLQSFVYYRHSDAAAQGVMDKKEKLENLLLDYGYGLEYPEKRWIISEVNIPRKAFSDYAGGIEMQRNFMIKTLILSQKNGIDQVHTYNLGDLKPYHTADNGWQLMGMYEALNQVVPGQEVRNSIGAAIKTTSDLLEGYSFDPALTISLNLPETVQGAAFSNAAGKEQFVLWAKTKTDMSDHATAVYSFPNTGIYNRMEIKEWNNAQNHESTFSGSQITLSGSPIFLQSSSIINDDSDEIENPTTLRVMPNPTDGHAIIEVMLPETEHCEIIVRDAYGRPIRDLPAQYFQAQEPVQIPIDLTDFPAGIYFMELRGMHTQMVRSIVKK